MALTTIEMNTLEKISKACTKYLREGYEIDWEARRFELYKIFLKRYLEDGKDPTVASMLAINACDYCVPHYKDHI